MQDYDGQPMPAVGKAIDILQATGQWRDPIRDDMDPHILKQYVEQLWISTYGLPPVSEDGKETIDVITPRPLDSLGSTFEVESSIVVGEKGKADVPLDDEEFVYKGAAHQGKEVQIDPTRLGEIRKSVSQANFKKLPFEITDAVEKINSALHLDPIESFVQSTVQLDKHLSSIITAKRLLPKIASVFQQHFNDFIDGHSKSLCNSITVVFTDVTDITSVHDGILNVISNTPGLKNLRLVISEVNASPEIIFEYLPVGLKESAVQTHNVSFYADEDDLS